MSKVIFLDIDGVLVTTRSHLASGDIGGKMRTFDKTGVGLVVQACREAGAKIVVCSSWRHAQPEHIMVDTLCWQGFPRDVLHADLYTPVVHQHRMEEIHAWLNKHPEVTHWVWLDDGAMGEATVGHWVKTDFDDGVLTRHYRSMLSILGVKKSLLVV